jgi:hypothetical protein
MRINKDYVIGEILDTIGMMQLNNEPIPVISSVTIDSLSEDFLFNWNEVGDPEANFDLTLLKWLREEFKRDIYS